MCHEIEKMDKDTAIKILISVGALVLLAVRLALPHLRIDAISIGLFVICILPWASTFVVSLKAPGGWEIELRELKTTMAKVIDSQSEGGTDTTEPETSQLVELTENERVVLEALTKAKVPLRSLFGIRKDTDLDLREVESNLGTLDSKGLAASIEGNRGPHWGITPDGRRRLKTS